MLTLISLLAESQVIRFIGSPLGTKSIQVGSNTFGFSEGRFIVRFIIMTIGPSQQFLFSRVAGSGPFWFGMLSH